MPENIPTEDGIENIADFASAFHCLDVSTFKASDSLIKRCQTSKVLVLYGVDEDYIKVTGLINETVYMAEQDYLYFYQGKIIEVEPPFYTLQDQIKFLKKYTDKIDQKKVMAMHDPVGRLAWDFETAISCQRFDVYKKGKIYSRGLIFKI